eukprot:scaffold37574_cov31-Prasinocladus_malaysianus.AAC.1
MEPNQFVSLEAAVDLRRAMLCGTKSDYYGLMLHSFSFHGKFIYVTDTVYYRTETEQSESAISSLVVI